VQGAHLEYLLTVAEIEALKALIGWPMIKLYAPAIEVCRYWSAAKSFVLPRGHEFLVVSSDWQTVLDGELDIYPMRVDRTDAPPDIPLRYDEEGRRRIGYPVSLVEIGPPPSPITSIAVLQDEKRGRMGTAVHDAALVFSLADGRRFVITAMQSIAGGVECATDDAAINEILPEFSTRLVITEA
jgi:hypothetical protein